MRWIYLDPTRQDEASHRAELLARCDGWWRHFHSRLDSIQEMLAGREIWDMAGWMNEHLHEVDPRLDWEFGQQLGRRHLVITPRTDTWLRPRVNSMLERAPLMAGWTLHSYGMPKTVQRSAVLVKEQTGVDIVRFRAQVQPAAGRKIDLVFSSPDCKGPGDHRLRIAALLAAEHLLGEEMFDQWVGDVTVARTPHSFWSRIFGGRRFVSWPPKETLEETLASEGDISLTLLATKFTSLVNQYRETLPEKPSHGFIRDASWVVFKRQPAQKRNGKGVYPALDDLITASCGRGDVFVSATGKGRFYSQCHSRHSEQFCYLKMDNRDQPDEKRLVNRQAMEDALNESLLGGELGCVIGGGLGLRYTYIMLSLMHVKSAFSVAQNVLGRLGAPSRTWLLFYDDELSREWLGLEEESPPPPGLT